jgi:hypothetical protein
MTDPFIDRIKDKGQQAKSLLSPWLRTSGTQGSEGGGHLPLNERLHLAASKMRVLDDRKLGNAHPERMRTFGAEITKKLQSIQDLVHFSPKIERDPSIWSQMDRVYPASIGEAPREPEQPGVMRAGTVIQKFSMTPKPGQSIESFKEQASRVTQPKPSAARPQKPALSSRARLYSRVQEITAKEKEPQSRIDDVVVPPDVPSLPELLSEKTIEQPSELTTPTVPPKSDLIEQVQNVENQNTSTEERETKPVVQDEVPPAKLLKPIPDLLPTSPAELPLQSPAPARTPSSKPKTSPAEKPSLPEAVSASKQLPTPRETAAGDPPFEKKAEPLKQARPVKKTAEPAASAPRPRAIVSSTTSAGEMPSKPASSPPSQRVQRQPDGSVLSRTPLPPRQSTDRPVSTGPSQTIQRQPETLISAKPVDPIQPKSDQQPLMPPIVSSKRLPAAMPVRQPDEEGLPAAQELARGEAAPPLPSQPITPPAQPDGPPIERAIQQPQELSPAFDAGVSEPAAEQDLPGLPTMPAMPLHTRLIERKSAARSIKSVVPDALRALRHMQARPMVSTQPRLISERRYRFDIPKADAPPSQIPHLQGRPTEPASPAGAGNQAAIQRMTETLQAPDQPELSTRPVTMVLAEGQSTPARTAARLPSLTQTPVSHAALNPANVQKDSRQKPAEAGEVNPSRKISEARIRPLKTKAGGVVQRRWEEHSDPQSGSSSGSDRAQEIEQQPVDLDQLANDIFPLVKRLLEIELERSSGSF